MKSKKLTLEIICSIHQITAEIREKWEFMLSESDNINGLYQSPDWAEYVITSTPDVAIQVMIFRNSQYEIVGIVPVLIADYNLKFDIYARSYYKKKFYAIYLLGSQPLCKEEVKHDLLLDTIWNHYPDCNLIYLDSLLVESDYWRFINKQDNLLKNSIVYLADSIRPFHSIKMAQSFDDYMLKFKAKKRYNYKRQLKIFKEKSEDNLQFIRVESREDIKSFLEDAEKISLKSWQNNRIGQRIDSTRDSISKISDLADRKILRSYLVKSLNHPVAFIIGYQFQGVFHYVEIAYDKEYSKYSPGTVALYMLIEDLHSYNSPQFINFGIGDAQYKKEFGNINSEDASILIMRRSIGHLALRLIHSLFKSLIKFIKKYKSKKTK